MGATNRPRAAHDFQTVLYQAGISPVSPSDLFNWKMGSFFALGPATVGADRVSGFPQGRQVPLDRGVADQQGSCQVLYGGERTL
jgi:hypothetical protein